jgi:hypothetical protein
MDLQKLSLARDTNVNITNKVAVDDYNLKPDKPAYDQLHRPLPARPLVALKHISLPVTGI